VVTLGAAYPDPGRIRRSPRPSPTAETYSRPTTAPARAASYDLEERHSPL